MNSLLNNSAALAALQSLNMTQQSLQTVQGQVSSGLAVATAADNSSYWSIAQQLGSDSGVVTAANTALSQGQSVLSTATSAIQQVITTLNSMATQLTSAGEPGASLVNINTALNALGQQLTNMVTGASFNGINVLNGTAPANMSFVSGFNASAGGGSVTTIGLATQSLLGSAGAATTITTTSQLTDPTAITNLKAVELANAGGGSATAVSITTPTATFGTDAFFDDTTNIAFTIQSKAQDGTVTTTTYTALDANGNSFATGGAATFQNAASYGVSTSVSSTANNLLNQGGQNLTTGWAATAANANAQLQHVQSAIAAITTYAGVIGATQNQMTAAATFNSALTTNYSNGIAGMVDADMNTASTRLQALQTQEQLGIQSLSIANQNAALVLKLFQ